ncbi:MAG: hypothetical protein CBC42_06645 [Betaproteobacteria bacterium TMED82]|nr:MAG: hypothetical protein CBC42_06645 [Betaproteobacteria bacterium TMED82]|tara:strand:- start:4295 stop:5173 length:879 start_codon:yes stop_codon:yes gene_type:complete
MQNLEKISKFNTDYINTYLFQKRTSKLSIVSLTKGWGDILKRHSNTPEQATEILGQLTSASVLLSSSIKHSGSVTLQIHGSGLINLAVSECRFDASFRSTVKSSEIDNYQGFSFKELLNRGNKGFFSVVLNQNISNLKPYQGIVSLDGNSLSEILENYLTKSEQLKSYMILKSGSAKSIGMLLQLLPDFANKQSKEWSIIKKKLELLMAKYTLDLDLEQAITEQLKDEFPERLKTNEPIFRCSCSKKKFVDCLKLLDKEEISNLLREKGFIEAKCEFCGKEFKINRVFFSQY